MENTPQVSGTDTGIIGFLMEIQKSVSEMSGAIRLLDERIERSLATIPRIDALEDRILRIETAQTTLRDVTLALKEENDKRLSRLWAAVQGTAAAGGAILVLILWAFSFFRVK